MSAAPAFTDDYVCPCGTKHGIGCLQLSPEDLRRSMRVAQLQGDRIVGTINLTAGVVRAKAWPDEPTQRIACSRCRVPFEMPIFLVEFVEKHRAAAVKCGDCRRAP